MTATAVSSQNTLKYDPAQCINCGRCLEVCPHGVFADGANAAVVVRSDACMECGACQLNCPAGAIEVESGVGCAYAMMRAALFRRKQATCGPEPSRGSSASCG